MRIVVSIMTLISSYFKKYISGNLIKLLLISLVFLSSGNYITAQQEGRRPKIGLALSGGGSSGMAHVGVLKVMEEAGLKPDLITGVSMGSIVGGMYSIGYSPDSLHKIFKNADWNYILSNNLPEEKVIFPEKHNFKNSAMSLPVSFRKVRLPSGLINGQQIESMLSFYAWPAAEISDFSKLPIPFMCVATDIIKTKIIDLKSGYLPDAMRASMAVPSIFSPIKIDSSLLIDGGVLRNIAVSELKEMGADIIIGSYTGFHKYKEEELETAAGILKQIGFLHSVIDYNEQKKMLDVVIEPDLKDYSSTVFTNADSIIQRGYKAALPFKPYFKNLADSLNLIGSRKPPEYILDRQYYSFDKIRVTGNKINSDEQILGVLDLKPGEQVNKYFLNEKIELLYGKGWFEKVKYRVESRNDSMMLVVDCLEKEKAIIYGSLHYDNDIRSGIVFNMSLKNLLFPKSTIDFDSFIGQYYRFRINFTQFIDRNQEVGLSLIMNADKTLIPVMKLKNETGQVQSRTFSGEINLNKMLGLNRMMSISANLEDFNLLPDYMSVNNLEKVAYDYYTLNYEYQTNTIDTKHFPNKGTISRFGLSTSKLMSGKIKTSFNEKRYTDDFPDDFQFGRTYTIIGNIKHYFSPGRKVSLSFNGDLLFAYHADSALSPNNLYYLGGFTNITKRSFSMTGFHSNEIPVEKLASVGFDADFEISRDLHLELMTDVAAAVEVGKGKDLTYLGGYGLGLGYMTILGPLRIGFMHGLSSTERYLKAFKGYLSIGFSF
jgi:NTE family protein